MAWNDVYQDDNAVHLLITIGGYKYNFRNGTDIKVERKIGDTLSKFSLGVIDDGSDNYIQFERVVLNRFVDIEIEYGNSSKDRCKYVGFVIDYQPVFFGPSTKLTVTGYLTRKQTGVPDQTSPYIYYIDWAPLVAKRKDPELDWDDIYNGRFSFVTDTYGNALNDSQVANAEAVEKKIAQLRASIENINWEKESKSIASILLTKFKDPNVISKLETTVLNEGTYGLWGAVDDGKGGVRKLTSNDITKVTIDDGGGVIVYFENIPRNDEYSYIPVHVGPLIEDSTWSHFFEIVESAGLSNLFGDAVKRVNNYLNSSSRAMNLEDNLRRVADADTYSGVINRYYQSGHVPWDYDILSKYTGNIVFSKFTHPKDTKRSIARVVPDLFVEWDRDTPASPEYVNKDSEGKVISYTSGDIRLFPDWAINDIKMFGLMYTFNSSVYTNSSDPTTAFTLDEYDTHGIKRVYKTKDKYYIWVGDIPDLYKKWKEANWDYNSKKYMKAKKLYVGNLPWTTYRSGETYNTVGVRLQYKNSWDNADLKYGLVQKVFTATDWDTDIRNGNIRHLTELDGQNSSDARQFLNYGEGYQEYKITAIKKDDPLPGMKAASPEERITKYLQATYRSAFPITYGQVYISDIVAQLCKLEGWNNPKIVATTATSYTADYLNMNGMTALEYITQKLCPNAMEEGGTGRVGFECHFDNKGIFHFEPIDININTNSVVLSLGYNVKDSAVLSFTVRSRGQALMLGIHADVSELGVVDGSAMAISRQGTSSSETEARLNSLWAKNPNYKPTFSFIENTADKTNMVNLYNANGKTGVQFFNLSLFNYYGFESTLDQYLYFLTKIGAEGSVNENMPYGTSLIRRSYESSSGSSTSVYLKALQDLKQLQNTCIQAEMTIIGNVNITPGKYIYVENYTRKGKHYTTGRYYVQSITDSVTSSGGFTQSLSLWRYTEDVYAMNNSPLDKTASSTYISTATVKSKFDEGVEIYQKQGEQAFKKWFQTNFPDMYYYE